MQTRKWKTILSLFSSSCCSYNVCDIIVCVGFLFFYNFLLQLTITHSFFLSVFSVLLGYTRHGIMVANRSFFCHTPSAVAKMSTPLHSLAKDNAEEIRFSDWLASHAGRMAQDPSAVV